MKAKGAPAKKWTIADTLEWTAGYFGKHGISNPRADAEILLAHALRLKRLDLILKRDELLNEKQLAQYKELIGKRQSRLPIAYILGQSEFMGLDFKVTPDTLIPRPETELLVEEACDYIKKNKSSLVLDVCTGSGNIAVGIASFVKGCSVYASDISIEALKVAQQNIDRNSLSGRIFLKRGDMLGAFINEGLEGKVDVIVSNPPYVSAPEMKELEPELSFEPAGALYGGEDGLDFSKKLVSGAGEYLIKGGAVFVELSSTRPGEIASLFKKSGFRVDNITKDYSGLERVLSATIRGK